MIAKVLIHTAAAAITAILLYAAVVLDQSSAYSVLTAVVLCWTALVALHDQNVTHLIFSAGRLELRRKIQKVESEQEATRKVLEAMLRAQMVLEIANRAWSGMEDEHWVLFDSYLSTVSDLVPSHLRSEVEKAIANLHPPQ